MKVFFNASLAGRIKHLNEYKEITTTIRQLGQDIIADHVMRRDYKKVNKQTKKEHEQDFQIARKGIYESDIMIVEGTFPSVGVGYLIGLALDLYKPVLILYLNTPHGLLIGDPNRLLTVCRYSLKNKNKLKQMIQAFVKKAENKVLKYRFNLMINNNQNKYLEETAMRERISKAELLRGLIDEKMKIDS